mmetsp:Transcript_22572/g.29304  ORF Transcript_22572/g.29304 Transcript_22572/m.29304 type:complete len:87 (+) Transcript_22572:533-793(+)
MLFLQIGQQNFQKNQIPFCIMDSWHVQEAKPQHKLGETGACMAAVEGIYLLRSLVSRWNKCQSLHLLQLKKLRAQLLDNMKLGACF